MNLKKIVKSKVREENFKELEIIKKKSHAHNALIVKTPTRLHFEQKIHKLNVHNTVQFKMQK